MTAKTGEAHAVALKTAIKDLAQDFREVNGRVSMPQKAFADWAKRLSSLQGKDAEAAAIELIAVALKFQELGPQAGEALRQIILLLKPLLGSAPAARQQLARAGIDAKHLTDSWEE